jgi:hypothetical protein
MFTRVVCLAGLVAFALGCGRQPTTQVVAPVPAPAFPDITTLALSNIDQATLASLDSLLEQLKHQSPLLSMLNSSDPRVYSLFRDLEAAQSRMNAMLSLTDAEGRTLYDRLVRMSMQADSLFRALEQTNPRPPRP